jgi:hypothetical protein
MSSVTTRFGTDLEVGRGPDKDSSTELTTETDGQAADVGRVPLRCGRTLPPVHLLEADHVLGLQYWHRPSYTALCGEEVSDPPDSGEDDDDQCPGCRDCVRYCAACTAEATRYAEHQADTSCAG